MKTLLTYFLVVGVLLNVNSQVELYKLPLKFDNNKRVYFDTIVEFKGHSAAQLYSAIRTQLSETYVSAKTVIDLEDKENGKIIAKGLADYTATDGWIKWVSSLEHTLKIYIKDEKVKITFDNLKIKLDANVTSPVEDVITDENLLYNRKGKPNKMRKSHKEEIIKIWIRISSELINSVNKKDNW